MIIQGRLAENVIRSLITRGMHNIYTEAQAKKALEVLRNLVKIAATDRLRREIHLGSSGSAGALRLDKNGLSSHIGGGFHQDPQSKGVPCDLETVITYDLDIKKLEELLKELTK